MFCRLRLFKGVSSTRRAQKTRVGTIRLSDDAPRELLSRKRVFAAVSPFSLFQSFSLSEAGALA